MAKRCDFLAPLKNRDIEVAAINCRANMKNQESFCRSACRHIEGERDWSSSGRLPTRKMHQPAIKSSQPASRTSKQLSLPLALPLAALPRQPRGIIFSQNPAAPEPHDDSLSLCLLPLFRHTPTSLLSRTEKKINPRSSGRAAAAHSTVYIRGAAKKKPRSLSLMYMCVYIYMYISCKQSDARTRLAWVRARIFLSHYVNEWESARPKIASPAAFFMQISLGPGPNGRRPNFSRGSLSLFLSLSLAGYGSRPVPSLSLTPLFFAVFLSVPVRGWRSDCWRSCVRPPLNLL